MIGFVGFVDHGYRWFHFGRARFRMPRDENPLDESVCKCGLFGGYPLQVYLALKNTTFLNFLGNMGYMSVKDENFPRAQLEL